MGPPTTSRLRTGLSPPTRNTDDRIDISEPELLKHTDLAELPSVVDLMTAARALGLTGQVIPDTYCEHEEPFEMCERD
jgi:hypothetical protein